jgi:hypothetical protein
LKRIERWVVTLLIVHGLLLIGTQALISFADIQVAVNPVYEYIGVFSESDSPSKKIDQLLDVMLSF